MTSSLHGMGKYCVNDLNGQEEWITLVNANRSALSELEGKLEPAETISQVRDTTDYDLQFIQLSQVEHDVHSIFPFCPSVPLNTAMILKLKRTFHLNALSINH